MKNFPTPTTKRSKIAVLTQLLLILSKIAVLTACTTKQSPALKEIEFRSIKLTNQNIEKYSFLEKYAEEQEVRRKKYNEKYQMDLTLPNEFPEIKLFIAENVLFNKKRLLFLRVTGPLLTGYCYNAGCLIAVYENGTLIGSFTESPQFFILKCNSQDFIVNATGPGINKKANYSVFQLDGKNKIYINELDPENICSRIEGVE